MLRSCPQNVPSGRDPQAKSRQKDVRNLRRDGLESLGIAPTSHFTNDRPQYLSHSQQESCRGANIVPKDIAVLSCPVLDTEVSRRLMHQRTSDPLCRVTSEPSFYKCAVQLRRALPIRPCPISRFSSSTGLGRSVPMADEQRHIPISKGHELVSHLARCFYSQIWTTDFRSLILQMIIIIRPSTPTKHRKKAHSSGWLHTVSPISASHLFLTCLSSQLPTSMRPSNEFLPGTAISSMEIRLLRTVLPPANPVRSANRAGALQEIGFLHFTLRYLTLSCHLLRAADRYAYTLWKHCLLSSYSTWETT